MGILKNIFSAFAMFSTVPMPKTSFGEKDCKYMLAFFPFIGMFIGGADILIVWLGGLFRLNNISLTLLLTIIPVLITGGIHLDGFMDCNDAFASHCEKEKMLSIMKDSHIGAFAALYTLIYFFVFFISIYLLPKTFDCMLMMMLIYMLSRCCSGLCTIEINKAKNDGLSKSISEVSYKKNVKIIIIIQILFIIIALFFINFKLAFMISVACLLISYYCIRKMLKLFKGITGDLAGWYLCLNELSMLCILVFATGGYFK